jgi:hypothetical protein
MLLEYMLIDVMNVFCVSSAKGPKLTDLGNWHMQYALIPLEMASLLCSCSWREWIMCSLWLRIAWSVLHKFYSHPSEPRPSIWSGNPGSKEILSRYLFTVLQLNLCSCRYFFANFCTLAVPWSAGQRSDRGSDIRLYSLLVLLLDLALDRSLPVSHSHQQNDWLLIIRCDHILYTCNLFIIWSFILQD